MKPIVRNVVKIKTNSSVVRVILIKLTKQQQQQQQKQQVKITKSNERYKT